MDVGLNGDLRACRVLEQSVNDLSEKCQQPVLKPSNKLCAGARNRRLDQWNGRDWRHCCFPPGICWAMNVVKCVENSSKSPAGRLSLTIPTVKNGPTLPELFLKPVPNLIGDPSKSTWGTQLSL